MIQKIISKALHSDSASPVDLPPVSIVGGGLVGSLLSLHLAKLGIRSDIFEHRSDIRTDPKASGRSINLAISVRGLYALREVGLEEEILKLAIPMRGRMIHSASGELTFQSYALSDSDCIYSISRSGLNQALMTAAEQTGRVKFHFNKKILDYLNHKSALLVLDQLSGQKSEITSPLVFGADGYASAIRDSVLREGGSCSEDPLDAGYKELLLPAGPDGAFQLKKNALHIWPRKNYMLIALPNLDGSFTCTLFLPFKGDVSFESLKTTEQAEHFFQEQFGDIYSLIPNLGAAFFEHPTGKMTTVKCEPWNLDHRVLLLGDAAHAIVPFFGQGMNCGFEDCSILSGLLSEQFSSNGPSSNRPLSIDANSWEKIFRKFSLERKKDSDKIADMAVENFVEMRDRVGDPKFLFEKNVEKILQSHFPGQYISRYALVSFSRFPYSGAYAVGQIQSEILSELCAGLEKPEEVNLVKAEFLIRDKLKPVFDRFV